MAIPSRPVVIRLPSDAAERFDRLCEEFAGLQPSAVMRMLVQAHLALPLDEQVEIVTRQIRKPEAKRPRREHGKAHTNRVHKEV